MILEVVRSEAEERFEDVKSSEYRVDVRILEKLPNVGLEERPCFVIFGNK